MTPTNHNRHTVVHALQEFLRLGERTLNQPEGHDGYFSGDGFAAKMLRELIDQVKHAPIELFPQAAAPREDRIRVLRLYSFEGPRSVVEATIKKSLMDGTNVRGALSEAGAYIRGDAGITISVATLGSFPEIMPLLPPADGSVIEYGPAVRVYRRTEPLHDSKGAYRSALAAGATHIEGGLSEDGTIVMWTLASYREKFEYTKGSWDAAVETAEHRAFLSGMGSPDDSPDPIPLPYVGPTIVTPPVPGEHDTILHLSTTIESPNDADHLGTSVRAILDRQCKVTHEVTDQRCQIDAPHYGRMHDSGDQRWPNLEDVPSPDQVDDEPRL